MIAARVADGQRRVVITTRRLAVVAVVGPALFWIVVALLTALEWEFLHGLGWRLVSDNRVAYPSSTALGQFGWVQVLNFGQVGVALTALAIGLWKSVQPRPTVGISFVFIAGVACIASMFKTDPPISSISQVTWHGWIHALAFVVLALSSILGMLTLAWGLRKDARWKVVDYAGIGFLVLFFATLFGNRFVPSISGLVQIVSLLVLFGWYEVLAVRLVSVARTTPQADLRLQLPMR